MTDDWLLNVHLLYEQEQKPAPDLTLDWVLEQGWHTEEGGGNETCHYYSKPMDWPRSGLPTERALSELSKYEGFLRLWKNGLRINFKNWEHFDGVPDMPYYTFEIPKAQLTAVESAEEGEQKANTVVDLIADFADETGAFYGFGDEAAGKRESERQHITAIREGNIDHVFWFNYFSGSIVSELGRERLLSAPAERVEERSDGAALLLPYLNPRHRESGTDPGKVEAYLGL